MAQRWSFEEDYILAKYIYSCKYWNIPANELNSAIKILEEYCFNARSNVAVNKRAINYCYLFGGLDCPCEPQQVREIARVIVDKERNKEWYSWLETFIAEYETKKNEDEEILDGAYSGLKNAANLINLEPLRADYFGPTFREVLFGFIDRKGMKDSEVYNRSYIDRSTFTRIRNGTAVSKRTVKALCFGLKLTLEEASILLKSAGFCFSAEKEDLIVAAYLKARRYDIVEANIQLHDENLPR